MGCDPVILGFNVPVCFQGPSQWVVLQFPQRVCVSQLQIQFQGGFSSRQGHLEGTGRPWELGPREVVREVHCGPLFRCRFPAG